MKTIFNLSKKDKTFCALVVGIFSFLILFLVTFFIFCLQELPKNLTTEEFYLTMAVNFLILVLGVSFLLSFIVFLFVRIGFSFVSLETYMKDDSIYIIQKGKVNVHYEIYVKDIQKIKRFSPAILIGKRDVVVVASTYYQDEVRMSYKRSFAVALICTKKERTEIIEALKGKGVKL